MNPRVRAIAGSLIRQIAARKRSSSIDLGLGEPTLLPNAEHFDAAMRWVKDHGVKYTPNAGDAKLRETIASHYAYPGLQSPENACVTVGSQEAMFATLYALLDPARDELLVVEPAFPSYAKMALLIGAKVRRVSMSEKDGFAFDAERIANSITARTRALVLCSPCNPTGRAISPGQSATLARMLERRGSAVTVVHDEIYREQSFSEVGDVARFYHNTIVVNSLSKSNALTGLRIGWFLAPSAFVEQATKVHAWTVSCADTFAQRVALHVFASKAVREHAPWYRRRYPKVMAALRATHLPFIAPEGSFYACVRLPKGTKSEAAALALVDEYDVVAIPGIAFGKVFEGWLRLAWVAALDDFREGLARIGAYAQALTQTL